MSGARPSIRRVSWALVLLATALFTAVGVGGYKLYAARQGASAAGVSRAPSKKAVEARLVPVEAYLRTYLTLFGGLAPLDVQARARGPEGLFDTWDDYVSALGMPDYKLDIPRQTQTNALMLATFERLGVALCDRAVEHDLGGKVPPPPDERLIFAFDAPAGELDLGAFTPRFDVLHRTFLGYPAALAPAERAPRFYGLYEDIAKNHAKESPKSKLTPEQAGWAAVCYGLVRHPEFHLY